MVKILIADDHPIVRRGLKQIVADEPDVTLVGEAGNAQEVLEQVRKGAWDLVILDIAMPGRSGLDVLKELKQRYPRLPVLILSAHPEDQFAIRVLKSGAAGYITKEHAPETLVEAIRKALMGGKYIGSSLAEKLVTALETHAEAPLHELLSNREFQVLRMIAAGKTMKEIAKELYLSIKTISTYRTRIMEKMKMKSDVELTRYVVENRLMD